MPPRDTIPANAATLYLRSLGENSFGSLRSNLDEEYGSDSFEKWQSNTGVPIEGLLDTPARQASRTFDDYVKSHIERATYCRYCDWGLGEEDLQGSEVITFLLPSVQETRSISRVLALQTRIAIAEKRFDRAVELMRMNYQLARNVGKMKFLVASLIGIAEVGMTNGTLIDMIATPDSPNMYYALSELPRPTVDLRRAFRMEMTFIEAFLPELFAAESADLSLDGWREEVKEISKSILYVYSGMGMLSGASEEEFVAGYMDMHSDPSIEQLAFRLAPTVMGVLGYADAKQQLIDDGGDPKKLKRCLLLK